MCRSFLFPASLKLVSVVPDNAKTHTIHAPSVHDNLESRKRGFRRWSSMVSDSTTIDIEEVNQPCDKQLIIPDQAFNRWDSFPQTKREQKQTASNCAPKRPSRKYSKESGNVPSPCRDALSKTSQGHFQSQHFVDRGLGA